MTKLAEKLTELISFATCELHEEIDKDLELLLRAGITHDQLELQTVVDEPVRWQTLLCNGVPIRKYRLTWAEDGWVVALEDFE